MHVSKNLILRTAATWITLYAAAGNATASADANEAKPRSSYAGPSHASWENGLDQGDAYFPIAVWLQDPKNAAKYRALGINVYVALWKGPTAEQIAELKRQRMSLICEQNAYALEHLDEKTIVGWMHGDEPDNAQSLPSGNGYGPPIAPEKIIAEYQQIRAKDPTRPVMLNLGQAVAWDGWVGRGVRSGHPEDYPEYCKGGDILSFDIYPAVHDKRSVLDKLWYVPRGVDRLRQWTREEKLVWNCIECTHIGNPNKKPTPTQVRAEVWMSIIYGSKGLIYFCHEFKPRFIEAGLLADEEMAQAVGRINGEVQSLAAVIHSPAVATGVKVDATPADVSPERAKLFPSPPLAVMVKKYRGATYLFSVRMEDQPATATFHLPGLTSKATAEVIGENRTLPVQDGGFRDEFKSWEVHLYRLAE
jgi:hypothetical protein